MLLIVPIAISAFGCGTVTMPGRSGWRKCLWLPDWRTSRQPSASISLMISPLRTTHPLGMIRYFSPVAFALYATAASRVSACSSVTRAL